jgi:cobalt-zinc-cadmium efflux system outer membrane protein
MRFRIILLAATTALPAAAASQARPLSRADAVEEALAAGARLGVARADTLVANAMIAAARTRPNPALSVGYSKDPPPYHVQVDLPFDFPGIRSLRIRSAQLGAGAAQLRFQYARATIALDADTTYTMAAAARARLALSARNAADADSLLHMVEQRQTAGDASDFDVEIARVNAGQQANQLAADSLTLVSTLLDLQAVLGMTDSAVVVVPADSLIMPPAALAPGKTVNETAAEMDLEAATLATRLQHRSVWSQPSINFGFDTGDPDTKGLLPVFGIGIALPLFDRNRAGIAQAEAEQARATAVLTLARVEARNQVAHATREREIALGRVRRDLAVVTSANRVAAMSLTAYREGAAALPNVLEAQRNARDVLSRYIDDLAAAWVATAELRVLALTPGPPKP